MERGRRKEEEEAGRDAKWKRDWTVVKGEREEETEGKGRRKKKEDWMEVKGRERKTVKGRVDRRKGERENKRNYRGEKEKGMREEK